MLNTVIRKEHDTRNGKVLSQPRKQFYPLLEKISEVNPDVRFTETPYSYDTVREEDGTYNVYISEYTVTIHGEEVGAVGYNSWGKAKFVLANERIGETVMRGRAKKTADIGKAVQIFKKYMYPSTQKEQAKKALDLCSRALSRFEDTREGEVRMAWRRIDEQVKKFAITNKELFEQASGQSLDPTVEALTIHTAALQMYSDYKEGNGMMVKTIEDKFLTITATRDAEPKVLSRDEMKPYDLQTIGMLKLLSDNQAILYRGYKVQDGMFIVFPETDHEPNIVSGGKV